MRTHALLSVLFGLSRAALDLIGLRFFFSLDWMWLSDPTDLRDRLLETLYYFHAFPPGMDAATGLLLKLGPSNAPVLAHAAYWILGLALINALYYLARAIGLSLPAAFVVALLFSLTPTAIYFEHLYLYDWPVATLLCVAAVLFHRGVWRPSFRVWFAFFAVGAAIGFTRSTFHLAWFVATAGLGAWLTAPHSRRVVLGAALIPAALLVALYGKNLVLFGEFAASTFGPASYTLVTVADLPNDVRDAWIRAGHLSSFASVSVYAPPREYAQFFTTPEHTAWPTQLTRLEHRGVTAANFNHWWLLEVHRARRADVVYYLRHRPLDYLGNVLAGVQAMFSVSTTWHPRDGTPVSPHYQHRQVLGRYEAWFNRLVHGVPFAPMGLYIFLPVAVVWGCLQARRWRRLADPDTRARGALLYFCVFQIVYVVAASTMLTALESARYRFQIESMIWLMTAACIPGVGRARERARVPGAARSG
ncbi:MAG: hypothetical protein H0T71_06025 [Acidobacteria bacterium]|nr:hypothetical protein [Acidobacteriota bacterium]